MLLQVLSLVLALQLLQIFSLIGDKSRSDAEKVRTQKHKNGHDIPCVGAKEHDISCVGAKKPGIWIIK